VLPISECSGAELHHSDFCSSACPCQEHQGDCDRDSDCADGLVCRHDVGLEYGLDRDLDVCGW
jgi:hypothetical protein